MKASGATAVNAAKAAKVSKVSKVARSVLLITVLCTLVLSLMPLSACNTLANTLKEATQLQVYTIGNETIPSINSVVGEREVTNVTTGTGTNGQYKEYTYKSEDVLIDVQKYIDFLQNQNWVVTIIEGTESSGKVQLGIESTESGNILLLTITYSTSSYSVNIAKTKGELNRL